MATAIIELPVLARDLTQKAKYLRSDDKIPAEYYIRGRENLHLAMEYQVFRKVYKEAGESQIIDLKLESESSPLKALVTDVQFDPITDRIIHVDFMGIKMDEEITTHVPLAFIGVSLAVKDMAGVLTTTKDEVEITCLPKDLPSKIEVDISVLVDFHVAIRVKDLVLPAGVKIIDNPEDVLVNVTPPRAEEVEEPVVKATPVEGVQAVEGEVAPKEGEAKAAEGEKKE